MTESTIDMDRAMQGIDCEVITWTKCSERMPPDKPGNPVIAKPGDGSVEKVSSRWLLNVLLPKLGKDKLEWTEFTPEKWKDLNK